MICHIDVNNGIPIYEQIERQVKFAVANGSLVAGERVLSVREMAGKIAVNVNTVARAYRNLQEQKVLNSIRGTGLVVTPEALKICRQDRLKMIRERLHSVLQEARQNQIEVDEVRTLVEDVWKQISKNNK